MNTTKNWKEPDPRDLSVSFLHFPRNFRAVHYDWDVDKGFRLEVLGPGHFWVTVGASPQVEALRSRPQGQEQDFQLWLNPESPRWDLAHLTPHSVCAILRYQGSFPTRSPSATSPLILGIRQWMPQGTPHGGNDFFTVEQILHQWGRVGRRVRRRARWRKWLPW